MAFDEELLLSLAAAIADGTPIDWSDVESSVHDNEVLGVVRRFHMLADLAGVHRAIHDSGPEAVEAPVAGSLDPANDTSRGLSLVDGRFVIERRLGKGSFGAVYQAYDRDRKAHLALKRIHHSDASSIYDFKKEFRVLADLWHPNLVVLYDLFADGHDWFIAMELIRGVDFVTYVCGAAPPGVRHRPLEPGRRGHRIGDWTRFGRATSQLVQALCYLHQHGKLHRDIKPPNVLVTDDGVVKVLDFGLTTDLERQSVVDTVLIRGTPAYVAPEQAVGEPPSETSDWYSLGAMLFEALTGERPFEGSIPEVLDAKQNSDGPAPSEFCDGIPEALDTLCRDLLQRNPALRPGDARVLATINLIWPPSGAAVEAPAGRRETVPFVGRISQLEALNQAFEFTMLGCAQTVFVRGGSGMGKTALVHEFMRALRVREPDAVVLDGRCYERESVPYKALDSVVDCLSRYLRRLSATEVEVLLPRDVSALTRLFPVLQRVEPIAAMRQRPATGANAQELRRRSFAAFRELLARLNDRHPVVLVIDDLQWGDSDSAALIADLMFMPDLPAMLLIGCYRSEDAFSSGPLQALLVAAGRAAADTVHHIDVDELSEQEAYLLARVLASNHDCAPMTVDSIVRESAGSPFFINELIEYSATAASARVMQTGPGADAVMPPELVLDSVIAARTERLAEGVRQLLHILAIAGGPLRLSFATEAAGLNHGAMKAITSLRVAHLTRMRFGSGGEEIELYHDRIRQALLARIPEQEVPRLHARLAAVLEASGDGDPETLLFHFRGAGLPHIAATYALAAGDRARDAVAFDRASTQYRLALDLGGFDRAKRREIEIKLGDALAASGRGYESAQAYLSAAEGALAAELLELDRRAAEQLLRSGHIEEGLSAIQHVLRSLGMELAESPVRALLSLIGRRMWLRIRRLQFVERDRSQLSAEELVRIDACWTVATAMGVVDTIRGADFQARHLLLALKTGDLYRVARAVVLDSVYAALGGSRTVRRQRALIDMASQLADRVRQPGMLALVMLAKGTGAFFQGRWKVAKELLELADPLLRECTTSIAWELDTDYLYRLLSLFYLGELSELTQRLPLFLKEARDRDDLTAATNLRTRVGYIRQLIADRPDQARDEVREGMAHWATDGFHAQHSWEMHAYGEIDLYEGRGLDAWRGVEKKWPALSRSLLLRIQAVRIESLYLRARSGLAAAVDPTSQPATRRTLARRADRAARKLAREGAPWASALGKLIAAGAATARADYPFALTRLEQAEEEFQRTDMRLHAAATRRRRGEIVGGSLGEQLIGEADDWMTSRSIRDPSRITGMLAPGAFRRDGH